MQPPSISTGGASADAETDNIHVVCRVRPPNSRELKERCREIVTVDEAKSVVNIDCGYGETKQYSFDSVFGPTSSQVGHGSGCNNPCY